MKCSVIICTHNPRDHYLCRVLEAMKKQTLPRDEWELLLIDNASTQPLDRKVDLSWHPKGRVVREDKLGLTHARLRGISESSGELLVFVDDDNIIKADYLQKAVEIGDRFTWLGVWGGSCLPEYESEPPKEIVPWLGSLAIYTVSAPIWAKLRFWTEACPCGAGMVVRRKLALHYQQELAASPIRQMLGRSGTSLGAGEDVDMILSGFDLGLGAGRFPELELTHIIPASRFEVDYLAKVLEGFGYSEVVVGLVHQPGYQAPVRSNARVWLNNISLLTRSSAERKIAGAVVRGRFKAYRALKGVWESAATQKKESAPGV